MSIKLKTLTARSVLDSRGNPTVEVEASTAAHFARAIVPSGASTGEFEAKELRDGGKKWGGLGVEKAVKNVSKIAGHVVGKQFSSQEALDKKLVALDGTSDKRSLGANAILGVSMVFCRLEALERGVPLYEHLASISDNKPSMPVIYANVINGGRHAANGLPLQEFMIVSKAKKFVDSVEEITRTYHELKKTISAKYGGAATGVGDEGGFAPPVHTAEEALRLLHEAAKAAGAELGFAIDAAASEFYEAATKTYRLHIPMLATQLEDYYDMLVSEFGVVSLEDPFDQHSFSDFSSLRLRFKNNGYACQVVGDDLTVSNPTRIEQASHNGSCDCLLLKPNQIGTVTEALQAAATARKAGWSVMVSHRSGETDDAFIAHLAVGLGCGQIKIGAPSRGERVAKYNELLRISESVKKYG